MSEGTGAEATASQSVSTTPAAPAAATAGISASADRGDAAADRLASGEAIDEMLAANDPPANNKRKYPDPGFAVERAGAVGQRGSYTLRFKLNAAAFTRAICPDGKPVGNNGAAKVLKVDRKRIITWVGEEEDLKGKVKSNPGLSKARSLNAGVAASTADVEQRIITWVGEEEDLKGKVKSNPGLSKARSLNAGVAASTADVEQALEDYR